MSKIRVIGLHSVLPRSGKDTAANTIKEFLTERGYKCLILSFAEGLRESLYIQFLDPAIPLKADRVNKDISLGVLKPKFLKAGGYREFLINKGYDLESPMSFRAHCIEYGTNYCRIFCDDDTRWLDIVLKRINILEKVGYDYVVVSDVRFQVEADALKDRGAKLVQIDRRTPSNRGLAPSHIDGVMYYINNNGIPSNYFKGRIRGLIGNMIEGGSIQWQ